MKGIIWSGCLWLQRIALGYPDNLSSSILLRHDILQVGLLSQLLTTTFREDYFTHFTSEIPQYCLHHSRASGEGLSKEAMKSTTRSDTKSDPWLNQVHCSLICSTFGLLKTQTLAELAKHFSWTAKFSENPLTSLENEIESNLLKVKQEQS